MVIIMIMKYAIEYTYRYRSNIHITNNIEKNDINMIIIFVILMLVIMMILIIMIMIIMQIITISWNLILLTFCK